MVTKPTGRPRGRPKGVHTPLKPLSRDPDRYFLAFVEFSLRQAERDGTMSDLKMCEFFATLKCGVPINIVHREGDTLYLGDPQPALDDARAGRGFHVMFVKDGPKKNKLLGAIATGRTGPEWQNRNIFRPHADAIRRKLCRITTQLPGNHPSRIWLGHMVLAWEACFTGTAEGLQKAARLTGAVKEFPYFLTVMSPFVRRFVAGYKPEPPEKATALDFLPLFLSPTT